MMGGDGYQVTNNMDNLPYNRLDLLVRLLLSYTLDIHSNKILQHPHSKESMIHAEAYLEPSQTSTMERFCENS